MKININVYKDSLGRYIAYDPDEILIGKTFAYSMDILKEVNLPELRDISIDIYEKERKEMPEQLKNFEGFNINIVS